MIDLGVHKENLEESLEKVKEASEHFFCNLNIIYSEYTKNMDNFHVYGCLIDRVLCEAEAIKSFFNLYYYFRSLIIETEKQP
jgi:hypothetical protein